mmetsp:Transcript_17998/g.27408  ORF Transcript_17998/g.27408 Transcript_17998/m.27408 type:complete len:358 (-) Transcript_17998:386-1459(-)
MAVGISPDQAARDLGAINRRRDCAKGVLHGRNIKASEMKELEHVRISQQFAQVWGLGLAFFDLDHMRVAVASRKLHNTQPVAVRMQAHGFTIDGHNRAEVQPVGQVGDMQVICHDPAIARDHVGGKRGLGGFYRIQGGPLKAVQQGHDQRPAVVTAPIGGVRSARQIRMFQCLTPPAMDDHDAQHGPLQRCENRRIRESVINLKQCCVQRLVRLAHCGRFKLGTKPGRQVHRLHLHPASRDRCVRACDEQAWRDLGIVLWVKRAASVRHQDHLRAATHLLRSAIDAGAGGRAVAVPLGREPVQAGPTGLLRRDPTIAAQPVQRDASRLRLDPNPCHDRGKRWPLQRAVLGQIAENSH